MENANNRLFEDMVSLAIKKRVQKEMDEYNKADFSKLQISRKVERKMRKLISQTEKSVSAKCGRFAFNKILIACVIAISFLFMLGMANPQIREVFSDFVSTVYDKYISITFTEQKIDGKPNAIATKLEPTRGIELYDRVVTEDTPVTYGVVYRNNNGKVVLVYLQSIYTDGLKNVGDVNGEITEITVCGNKGIYIKQREQYNIIVWEDDQYVYSLEGYVPVSEIIEIAESIYAEN